MEEAPRRWLSWAAADLVVIAVEVEVIVVDTLIMAGGLVERINGILVLLLLEMLVRILGIIIISHLAVRVDVIIRKIMVPILKS